MSNTQASYSYDKLGRLDRVVFSNGASATYSYDEAGNRRHVVEVPALVAPSPSQVSALPKRQHGDFRNQAMIVMLASGDLVGWGDNTTGVLANGNEAATNSLPQLLLFDPNTVVPPATATIVDWAFNNASVYVVYSNGWVYSAGSNSYGQLGHGDLIDRIYLKRIEYFVTNSISVTGVWAGGGYTPTKAAGPAYFAGGNYMMYGCGLNAAGNLGNGNTANQSSPVVCGGLTAHSSSASHVIDVAIVIVSSSPSAYMLTNDGYILVAGYNGQGQLGNNTLTNQTTFVNATTSTGVVSNAVSISANGGSTTAGNALYVDRSGNVWTVGYNTHGELGLGNTQGVRIFTQVTALSGISKAEIGGGLNGYAYALSTAGILYTWGFNGLNNLFLGNSTTPQSTPVAVPTASLPAGSISKVFFPCSSQGATTTPQLIVLTGTGKLAYAGSDNSQFGAVVAGTPYKMIPTPKNILDGTDPIEDVFVHGVGVNQRWFVRTLSGNLYACGDNTDSICTGAFASTTNVGFTAWQPIVIF